MNNHNFIFAKYNPSKEVARVDFNYLRNKLLKREYENIDDFDDDYLFFIRTYYYSLFENLNAESRDELFKDVLKVQEKRKDFMVVKNDDERTSN